VTPDAAGPSKTSNELAEERTALAHERTALAGERNQLALARTFVALDRTLMAWIRTALSLISFGFTIYKVVQAIEERPHPARLLDARGVALVLIAIGVGGLTAALIEYRNQLRALHAQYKEYGPFRRTVAPVIATVIAGLGLIGFILVFLRQ
jgi:putative membrane protein